ncbi:hypothetical protein JZU71_02075, partial [bacterium]|nr:hypothetical protein [bacterium]
MTPLSSDKIFPKSPLYWLVGLLLVVNLGLWLLAAYSIHRSYRHSSRVAEATVFNLAQALDETI